MSPGRERTRWLWTGIACWTVVAGVWALDVGFQYLARGVPAWWAVVDTLLVIAPGVALSPVVFLAFRRLVPDSRSTSGRVLLYAGIGVAYWLLWSVSVVAIRRAGLVLAEGEEAALGITLVRVSIGYMRNSILLYAVMVMLREVVRHVQAARRQEIRRSRLQAELARARTAALRAQLNPHFLFNTLHVVSGLTGSDVPAARQVLSDLGELLREALTEGQEQLVPLRDEIRLVEQYVGIQKARFRDRLQVGFQVDPATHDLGVPPMLLQPLVENAVLHGIALQEDGGSVRISAARSGGRLQLAVEDSGAGFPGGAAAPARERVGIGGTRARLGLLFGDAASLSFSYPPAGGFRVEVSLPGIEVSSPVSGPPVSVPVPVAGEPS